MKQNCKLFIMLILTGCILFFIMGNSSAGQQRPMLAYQGIGAIVLTVNGSTEDQTLGITEKYSWTVTLPGRQGSTAIRILSGNTWMYFTAQGSTFTMTDVAPQTPGVYNVYAQYVTNGVSAFSSSAVWSECSNEICLTVLKYGEMIPGTVTVHNPNATLVRGENLRFSFGEGQHVSGCLVYLRTEGGSMVSERMEYIESLVIYEYPTADLAPGNYILSVWYRGEAGYSNSSGAATVTLPFIIIEAEISDLLFSINRTEGLVGEKLFFSAYHPDASEYEISYQTESSNGSLSGFQTDNGAIRGTIVLQTGMRSLNVAAVDVDGMQISSKTIPLEVISYGVPEITVSAPDGIREGVDLNLSFLFHSVAGSTDPVWSVNIKSNNSMTDIECELTQTMDQDDNILIQCRVPAILIPSSGVCVFARYDPQVIGWEQASVSKAFFFTLSDPAVALSADVITIGTDVTVSVEGMEGVSYFAIMPYMVSSDGQISALMNAEQFLLCDGSEQLEYTFPGSLFLEAGNCRIDVRAVPVSSEKRGTTVSCFLTVSEEMAEKTVLSVCEQPLYYINSRISFDTGVQFSDLVVKVYRTDEEGKKDLYEDYDTQLEISENWTFFYLIFPDAGLYTVYAGVKENTLWRRMSDPVMVTVETTSYLDSPEIIMSSDLIRAGKDVTICYILDPKSEKAEIILDKRIDENYYITVLSNSLSLSKSEYKMDGAFFSAGEYRIRIRCSATGFEDSFSSSDFSISGERTTGPQVIASTTDTYINRSVTFTAHVDRAAALRISYSINSESTGYDYDQEIQSENGDFSWESRCSKFEIGRETTSWCIKAMALVDGAWSEWGASKVITIRYRGILAAPAFVSVREQLEAGDEFHVTVSTITNATGYKFRLLREERLIREWLVQDNDVTLISKGDEPRMTEGLYILECSAYAEDYIPLGPASVEITVTALTHGGSTLILPNGIEIIEDYAFEGTASEIVVIQNQCRSIGAYAFANMPYLTEVYIPRSVTQIDDTAFEGCGKLTVCTDSEYVASYAQSQGMSVKAPD